MLQTLDLNLCCFQILSRSSYDTNIDSLKNYTKRFEEEFPDIPAYLQYTDPDFKIRVGNFRTRIEAIPALKILMNTESKEINTLISYGMPFIVMDISGAYLSYQSVLLEQAEYIDFSLVNIYCIFCYHFIGIVVVKELKQQI